MLLAASIQSLFPYCVHLTSLILLLERVFAIRVHKIFAKQLILYFPLWLPPLLANHLLVVIDATLPFGPRL